MAIAAPWRDPKTGIWKLRKRVPAKYWPVAGNRVIKVSTGTADRAKALLAWPSIMQQWAEKEAAWEQALHVVTLDADKAREVAATWAGWIASGAVLDTGNGDPSLGSSSDIFELLVLPEHQTAERIAVMWDRVEVHSDEALSVMGIAITPESRPLLLQTMLPVVQAAYLQADLYNLGVTGTNQQVNPLPVMREALPGVLVPARASSGAPGVALGDILAAWKTVATVKPRTVKETSYALSQLERFLGHEDARRVTTGDLRRWRDDSLANGRNNNTWNGQLSMVGQVFLQAHKDGLLPSNPADKSLRLKSVKHTSPLPYSDAQAAQILNASRLETRASIRWAHWIMAFTGMRVAEVMQLSVADLRADDGLHYFAIHEDSPDKSVKTSERRNVPMHSALIREGLLKYAASLPKDGPLFPDKRPDAFGLQGGRAYNVVGRWVRDVVKLTDPRLAPNHSWRHRVEDELRGQEVPEDVRDAITGHARKTTGRNYGVRKEALRRLAEAIEKLPLPDGLMLKN